MIEEIRPRWYHGYGNMPSIEVVLENDDISRMLWLYTPVPADSRENVMLISTNNDPWVKFVYIDKPDGNPRHYGALGGDYQLTDGSTLKSRTGWSSRAGVINRNYANHIRDYIVDVTVYRPGHNTGWAGFSIYKSYLENHFAWPDDLHMVKVVPDKEPYWTISTDPNEVVKPKEDGSTAN